MKQHQQHTSLSSNTPQSSQTSQFQQPYGNAALAEALAQQAQQNQGEEVAMSPMQRAGLLLGGGIAITNMMSAGGVPNLSDHWGTYKPVQGSTLSQPTRQHNRPF